MLIVCHFCACYIAIFTASCYVIFTFCNGIKNEIRVLDESSKAGGNSVELMKRVGDIVEFHAVTKQLSHTLIVLILFEKQFTEFLPSNSNSFHK